MTGSAGLLEALPRHQAAHGALLADILDVLHGSSPAATEPSSVPPAEELSPGELRVLRYLPTNLSRPEIAGELSVSLNTVSTHLRSIYAKLQVRDRSCTRFVRGTWPRRAAPGGDIGDQNGIVSSSLGPSHAHVAPPCGGNVRHASPGELEPDGRMFERIVAAGLLSRMEARRWLTRSWWRGRGVLLAVSWRRAAGRLGWARSGWRG